MKKVIAGLFASFLTLGIVSVAAPAQADDLPICIDRVAQGSLGVDTIVDNEPPTNFSCDQYTPELLP